MTWGLNKLKAVMLILLALVVSGPAFAQFAVTSANLNTRMSPSINGRIITVLPKGSQIEVIRNEGEWTLIQTPTGRRSYVASRYLRNITEATTLPGCVECLRPQPRPDKLNIENIQQVLELANPVPEGSFASCITGKLIQAAKDRVRDVYGGRKHGGGTWCALAVRKALNLSGIWTGGGIGNAREMIPGLTTMGFQNIIQPGMTPDNAPNNSILVYGAKLPGARGCSGKGNIYGHVEIKESNSSFIYDGNPTYHIQQAISPRCRPLIGVMVMGESCPTCTNSLKRSCGA